MFFRRLCRALIVALLLAACGQPAGPRSRAQIETDLHARWQAAESARAEIADLWQDLLNREQISCSRRVSAPEPFELSPEEAAANDDLAPLLDTLNAGIARVAESAAVWDEECRSRDEVVTDEVIEAGVQAAQAAEPLLAEVRAALDTTSDS